MLIYEKDTSSEIATLLTTHCTAVEANELLKVSKLLRQLAGHPMVARPTHFSPEIIWPFFPTVYA